MKQKLYKLTDENGMTRDETQWGPGATHSGTGAGGVCGPGYIHAYEHPLLAVLLNPIHANFRNPRLWEAEGEIALRDGHLKCGCVSLTTLREIPVPKITAEQCVRFAILCAKQVFRDTAYTAWADKWLSGEDRSAWAATATAWAATAAARAATAAARAAAWAWAAWAWAARAARAAEAAAAWAATAWAAAEAAEAAEARAAATAAARAAAEAARAADIDLIAIAEEAICVK